MKFLAPVGQLCIKTPLIKLWIVQANDRWVGLWDIMALDVRGIKSWKSLCYISISFLYPNCIIVQGNFPNLDFSKECFKRGSLADCNFWPFVWSIIDFGAWLDVVPPAHCNCCGLLKRISNKAKHCICILFDSWTEILKSLWLGPKGLVVLCVGYWKLVGSTF